MSALRRGPGRPPPAPGHRWALRNRRTAGPGAPRATPGAWSQRRPARSRMSTRAWQPRCDASCPRCAASAVLSTCNATCWPSRIACASVWRARLPPSSGPPGSLSRRSAWPMARWHKELPEAVNCLSLHGRHPVLRVPRAPLGPTAHHEQPRAPAHRGVMLEKSFREMLLLGLS